MYRDFLCPVINEDNPSYSMASHKKEVEHVDKSDGTGRYSEAVKLLPLRWQRPASQLGTEEKNMAEEFRLRAGQPLTVLLPEGEIPLEDSGMCITAGDLDQMCDRITGYSRYAATETLRHGYLTADGGFRVGVCGTAVIEDGVNTNMRDISSMTVRISRQRIGVADKVFPQVFPDGVSVNALIISPPGLGKTTLLRDMIRMLSDGVGGGAPKRVAVVDERGEIAVMKQGLPQMDVGCHTDVLDGCPKAIAIPILLRACNPQVIAVDEITEREDLAAMAAAFNCGVSLLATIHAAGPEDLQSRPLLQQLLELRVFTKCVTISARDGKRVYEVKDL